MPKGVEHRRLRFGINQSGHMKNPLMPKGVEHKTDEQRIARYEAMKNPLMPKGVEHLARFGGHQHEHHEEPSDAERR